jgi:hypothetical protein
MRDSRAMLSGTSPSAEPENLTSAGYQKSFTLKGRSVYELISTLAPFMTGEMTVGELCRGLDPKRSQMVRSVIRTLLDRGVVKDQVPENPDVLPQEVAAHFRRQIELIDHYANGSRARFKAFRESSVLMVGNGDGARGHQRAHLRLRLGGAHPRACAERSGWNRGIPACLARSARPGDHYHAHLFQLTELDGGRSRQWGPWRGRRGRRPGARIA